MALNFHFYTTMIFTLGTLLPKGGAYFDGNLGYSTFGRPVMGPRTAMFSSTSSSLHGGSSSGTAGSAAAFGTSTSGVSQSSSMQDGTAGATSGSAATHNLFGKNRARGSSAKGGTSSSTGGHGAASGLGYLNNHMGQLGVGNIGNAKGYLSYASGEKADGLENYRYTGSSRPQINSDTTGIGGYAVNSGNAGYVHGDAMNQRYGRNMGSSGCINSNILGGHTGTLGDGSENPVAGNMGGYKHFGADAVRREVDAYVYNGGNAPAANIKANDLDVYGEGLIGTGGEIGPWHDSGRGAYEGSEYDGFSYNKEAVGDYSYGSLGAHGRGIFTTGGHNRKQGYAGTDNYVGSGFEERWESNNGPVIMGVGDSNVGLGSHAGETVGYDSHLIGSSSSSGYGGSSSATSGYGAALGASAEGRAHSSSSHDGASEATSGLAAAMGIHGKNMAQGSSKEKGTSTGTGGMAAASATGGIKTRFGTYGSSSSSGHGGSSTGTSGFGAAIGAGKFGRAQSSSLYDGTSGATSGFGATHSLYGRNRISGSSSAHGTSSGTGGYGAATGVGYGNRRRGNKRRDGGTLRYRNAHGVGRYPEGAYGTYGQTTFPAFYNEN